MATKDMSPESADRLTQLWRSQVVTGATSDMVYKVLQEAIVSWVLPPGQRLGEEQLARQFDVSRTPVREALLRLEAEDFAERIPRRGLIVGQVTPQQIIDVYVVRGAVDGLAAELAAEHANPADISNLTWINTQFAHAVETGDLEALAEVNLQFHEAVAHASRNALLEGIVKQVHFLVRRFRSTTFAHPGRAEASIEEHHRLVEAIQAGNPKLAREIAEDHMSVARQIRIAMLERDGVATPGFG